ncbi:TmcC family electron transfer complex membrane anchor subunit [Thermodesulfobacteriota bacterium]
MYGLYKLATGPLAWLAFIIFIAGSLYKVFSMINLAKKKEDFIFTYMSWKYSLRSILHWIMPFGSLGWRSKPVLTVVTFIFHICLFAVPLFLMSHVILFNEAFGTTWNGISDFAGDIMTIIVILSCLFFLIRRMTQKEVRFVTSPSDFVLLVIVASPFITGFIVYHQLFAYQSMMVFHIITGEIMIAVIPFTRLSHMILSPLTRAYMGSEFGGVRHARDY